MKNKFLCVAMFATFGVFAQEVHNVVETQIVMVNGYPQIETWKNNRYVPTTQIVVTPTSIDFVTIPQVNVPKPSSPSTPSKKYYNNETFFEMVKRKPTIFD